MRPSRPLALGVLAALPGARPALPCSRVGDADPRFDVRHAEAILVATAVRYLREPKTGARTTGEPESLVGFDVVETLKGRDVPRVVGLAGSLDDRDDFNDGQVPDTFVRPGGRAGSCVANSYKKGAAFLLLKTRDGAYTVDWGALAPVNEQLHGLDDPWVSRVRKELDPGEPEHGTRP